MGAAPQRRAIPKLAREGGEPGLRVGDREAAQRAVRRNQVDQAEIAELGHGEPRRAGKRGVGIQRGGEERVPDTPLTASGRPAADTRSWTHDLAGRRRRPARTASPTVSR